MLETRLKAALEAAARAEDSAAASIEVSDKKKRIGRKCSRKADSVLVSVNPENNLFFELTFAPRVRKHGQGHVTSVELLVHALCR